MLGYISKKKLKDYIEEIERENRAEKLGQNYDSPISESQQNRNLYLQGYEDGTSNFYNALCSRFKIKRAWGGNKK